MEAEKKAYRSLATQFDLTYFMPFALVANSLLARLYAIEKELAVHCVEAHHCLTLSYLSQVTLSNPLRAHIISVQLSSYHLDSHLIPDK